MHIIISWHNVYELRSVYPQLWCCTDCVVQCIWLPICEYDIDSFVSLPNGRHEEASISYNSILYYILMSIVTEGDFGFLLVIVGKARKYVLSNSSSQKCDAHMFRIIKEKYPRISEFNVRDFRYELTKSDFIYA